jgi:catechol 2,3-dioxygenase-like lactoylglutathione lyase family enzyme
MPVNHMGFNVKSYAKSKAFYEAALAPLGFEVMMEEGKGGAIGEKGAPTLWLQQSTKLGGHMHIAFTARTRKAVDAFYAAAIEAGGKDNGKPGIRKAYSPTYYAAFVLDPDGHNIEAVCHKAG